MQLTKIINFEIMSPKDDLADRDVKVSLKSGSPARARRCLRKFWNLLVAQLPNVTKMMSQRQNTHFRNPCSTSFGTKK